MNTAGPRWAKKSGQMFSMAPITHRTVMASVRIPVTRAVPPTSGQRKPPRYQPFRSCGVEPPQYSNVFSQHTMSQDRSVGGPASATTLRPSLTIRRNEEHEGAAGGRLRAYFPWAVEGPPPGGAVRAHTWFVSFGCGASSLALQKLHSRNFSTL